MFDEIIKFKNVTVFFIDLGMKVAVLMVGVSALSAAFFIAKFVE